MNRRQPYRKHRRSAAPTARLRGSLLPSISILMVAYFCYHAVQGNYGLLALNDVKVRQAHLSQRASTLSATRAALEKDVSLMRSSHLDPDMLDEQVRKSLGFVREDERMILLPPSEAIDDLP